MPEVWFSLIDRLERLSEAVLTHASREGLPAHDAAVRVAEQRHEVRHARAEWQPPRDSFRAADLPR
jgi:hypothetical protein